MSHATAVDDARRAFYARISEGNCTPLWEVQQGLVSATPRTPCVPCHWRWQDTWPWLREAGELITAREAERRVLVLENPGLRGQSRITHSLYAGLQLILPGETAPRHRHSQSALRFVLHGDGACTSVDGRTVTMRRGDFVITPSWRFHDHGNPSSEPMVWLDGLDVPIVQLLDAQFLEHDGDAAPDDDVPLIYPWSEARDQLDALRAREAPHRCHGYLVNYTRPVTGAWALPSMGASIRLLPRGFRGDAYRSTDSTVFAVLHGSGRCHIGDTVFAFVPNDVFVCPSWMPRRLEADDDCVLFGFSDRPVQEALGLFREAF